MSSDELRRRIEYFKDLGVKDLYKREAAAPVAAAATPAAPAPEIVLPSLVPAGDSLVQIGGDIGDCRRCRLHEGRNKIVFGVGNPEAKLVFVGEGPGAD